MKLFIQGFKSIRDGQSISVGKKLTFLVGPNSAGKSIVHRALIKISGEDTSFDFDLDDFYKNPYKSFQISSLQTLGITWEKDGLKYSNYSSYKIHTEKNQETKFEKIGPIIIGENDKSAHREGFLTNKNLDEKIDVYHINEYYINDKRHFIEMFQNNENSTIPFAKVGGLYSIFGDNPSSFHKFTERTGGRLAKDFKRQSSLDKFYNLLIKNPKKIETLRELQSILKKIIPDFYISIGEDFVLINLGIEEQKILQYLRDNNISGKQKQEILNFFQKITDIVLSAVEATKKSFKESYPINNLQTVLVSGSRTPPQTNELSTILGRNEKISDIQYFSLYLSGTYAEWSDYEIDITTEISGENTLRGPLRKTLETYSKINKSLSEELFIDNGYQIKVKSSLILEKNDFEIAENNGEPLLHKIQEDDNCSYEEKKHVFLCQICLIDSHGRELNFDDVGSGIGYVFPVIYHAFCPENKNKIVFMQQPELHLHPAMQANLTDTLIQGCNDRRIIAETHSEHMILRALKRIRQTTDGTLTDDNLRLTPDDVAINYFEPLGDGSTRVHIIRISEDGDFLDRWPQGFFAERDQELFDE